MAISRNDVQIRKYYQEIAPQAFPSVTTAFGPRNDVFSLEGLGSIFYIAGDSPKQQKKK